MKDSFRQNKLSGFKRKVCGLALSSLVLSAIMPAFLYPLPIKAQGPPVYDNAAFVQRIKLYFLRTMHDNKIATGEITNDQEIAKEEKGERSLRDTVANAVYVASKEALHYLLNTMAFDIATWLASGDEGQKPMFITEGWGEYLFDVVDGAAGMFLEDISGDWLGNFNICNPSSISLKINIGLGIARTRRPAKPDCSITDIVNNWDNFVNDPNFLQKFAPVFDPYGNDIGIAFSMFEEYDSRKQQAEKAATEDRKEGQGAKGVIQKIAGNILTPSFLVRGEAQEMLAKGMVADEKVDYGDIVLDAASTFVNTLAGKLFERLFKEGLAALSGSKEEKDDKNGFKFPGLNFDLYTGEGIGTPFAGKQTAENRFEDIRQVGIKKGRVYDVLSKLSVCSNAAKPGPEECVIKPEFRTAIERKLTLREAIDQQLVNGEAPFGFMDYDSSAIYRGYPFRSIQILRSYRVVPVGWELAATAISKFDPEKTFNLNRLIALYDDETSPYKGLIDQNWVLTLPEHFCKAEGPGPKITNEELVGGTDANQDGDFKDAGDLPPERKITRQDYCADYQSCLEKNTDGSCKYYGYCAEDKRIWDFGGALCPEYFNTCETFQKTGGNEPVSYLANSLVFNNCGADNAGCRWYCAAFNAVNNVWTCQAEGQNVINPCLTAGGCPLSAECGIAQGQTACFDAATEVNLSISAPCGPGSKWWAADANECVVSSACTVPKGGVACTNDVCDAKANLLPNAGFETGAALGNLAANWSGDLNYFRRVSGASEKIYSGKNSVKFYNANTAVDTAMTSSEITGLAAGAPYTFSGWVYNKLNAGAITITINGIPKIVSADIKNVWQEISFDFDGAASTVVSVAVANDGNPVSGTAWFDNFRISEACVTNPVTLSLIGDYAQPESKLHLDRDAADCPGEEAGCSQFIRTRAGLGTNLIANGGFEIADDSSELKAKNWSAPTDMAAQRVSAGDNVRVKSGAYSAKLDLNSGSDRAFETVGSLTFTAGKKYIASAWVYVDSAITNSNVYIDLGAADIDNGANATKGKTKEWRRLYYAATAPQTVSGQPRVVIGGSLNGQGSVYVDDFQVEEVGPDTNYPTNYKEYGSANLVYLKKPPEFLGCLGVDYEAEPSQCFDYALYCQPEEVGCENYTPILGGPSIPGVTVLEDYCPAECVGYGAFSQSKTPLESQEPLEYFIPETARACQASQAGCEEFTNLDEVAKGGEGREYYQYLRQCQKPAETSSCRNFYAWQGSDEAGYQLKVYNLISTDNIAPDKVITDYSALPAEWCPSQDSTCCDGAEDLALNPFCRELLAIDGTISYTIYPNTVSCSDNCHPYRMTRRGEDDGDAESNCEASRGAWDSNAKACTYQVIPGEGISCPAQAAGCREYQGNAAGNLFTVFSDTFEDGDTKGWSNGVISNEALSVAGHSVISAGKLIETKVITLPAGQTCSDALVKCDAANPVNCYNQNLIKCAAGLAGGETCLVDIGQTSCGAISQALTADKRYLLSFWAKSAGASLNQIEVKLGSGQGDFGAVKAGPEWEYYLLGPVKPAPINPDSFLQFSGAGDFYLDNVRLQEIQDYAYVIKNSWQTPPSCDTNPWVDPPVVAPQFMLGCRQYQDSRSQIHNLKSFDHLCREDAVGCEALFDTFNYSSPFAEVFNPEDEIGRVSVPADKIVYLTNRPDVACSAENKGCQPLGLPNFNVNEINEDVVSSFNTVFKINNPDDYQNSLCASAEVGCEEYQSRTGFSYFKDPGNKTCEFRLPAGETETYGWFKTSRDRSRPVATLPDCPLVESPVGSLDYPGHPGANGFAGLCPAEYSACTQFIDPVSDIAKNLVFNYDFKFDFDNDGQPDGWDGTGTELSQKIVLKPYTLYTLAAEGVSPVSVQITDCNDITSFDQSLILSPAYPETNQGSLNLTGFEKQKYSGRFMTKIDTACVLKVDGVDLANNNPAYVALRQTVFDYVLGNTVDKTGCNGAVDAEKGCVLFNDRSGVNYKFGETDAGYLAFDADISGPGVNGGLPVLCRDLNCDANAVLKVRPDRTCETWLACAANAEVAQKKGELKNYCLSLGLCNSNDEKGNCDNFVLANSSLDSATTEMIKNLSGYIYTGLNPAPPAIITSPFYVNYSDMKQYGGTAKITNGDFEQTFGGRSEPVGWSVYDNNDEGWDDQKFRVVVDGQNSIEGASYLRLNSLYQAVSEDIEVERNQKYVLTGWVNTLDLQDSDRSQNPQAQICLVKGGAFNCPNDLKVDDGLPWRYISHELDSGNNDIIKIVLQNYSANVGLCRADPDNTSCTLGGFSLFDMITLDSVLNLTTKTPPPPLAAADFEARTCRIFPKSDALACRFNDAGTLYFGQYGYCVLKDPQNKDQCLQWWPVDQIQGEILEDLPNYSDRAPLYYCLEKSIKNIKIGEFGGLVRVSAEAEGTEYAGARSLDSGKEVKFVPFKVPAEYRPLFRWPYITRFEFTGVAGGMGAQSSIGALFINATMMKDKGCVVALGAGSIGGGVVPMGAAGCFAAYGEVLNDNPGICEDGWTPGCVLRGIIAAISAAAAGIIIILDAVGIDMSNLQFTDDDEWGGWGLQVVVIEDHPLVVILPWHTAQAITFSAITTIITQISDLVGLSTIQAGTIGMKIITDQDSEFAGVLPDPVPDMPGDILGAAWFVDSASDPGVYAAVLTGVFKGEFNVQYCSKLAQVVTSAGGNKGWANKLNEGSGFILNETVKDFSLAKLTDDDPDNDTNNDKETIPVKYKYEDPFNLEKFLADSSFTYRASDYRPFASIVPPDDAQSPGQWDSRPDTGYRQPLYYEPPREALGRPYQPRLGEVHSILSPVLELDNFGLEKLFLKSYNDVWQWNEGDINLNSDDGYSGLEEGDLGYFGWDLLEVWGANGGYTCAGTNGTRSNQDEICRVRPIISKIKVDDNLEGIGITIKKNKAVKLSFNVKVDPEQLPLKSYVIDWGDGEVTSVFGATLRGRENTDNPFVFYHPYDYWQMIKQFAKEKAAGTPTNLCCEVDCGSPANTCMTKVKIKVKDNWNAESCRAGGDCVSGSAADIENNKFVELEGTIRVEMTR